MTWRVRAARQLTIAWSSTRNNKTAIKETRDNGKRSARERARRGLVVEGLRARTRLTDEFQRSMIDAIRARCTAARDTINRDRRIRLGICAKERYTYLARGRFFKATTKEGAIYISAVVLKASGYCMSWLLSLITIGRE